ncbi:MAG TPA: creatininase family protein [Hyphomonas sp.]|nr:creatininase family protein [Hyphomonas sp.]MCA8905246.1 creatininase family protein [Hyphomonas sp.]MCB9970796.1 creatininase family protein [Hyphomonas sp.]HPE47029.1 creatininase family protein [Hyphomonas sp.]
MLLPVSTWPDIEAWLKKSRTIVIPIGSMEQHGPNGFIGTDAICPEVIAHQAERLAPDEMLVGPTFAVGCAQHHLGFPGTITLRPSTMIAAMADWTESLMRHGFERIYWLNGHGGNVATIDAAFAEIHAHRSFDPRGADNRPGLSLKRRNWWDFVSVMNLCNQLYPTGHGSHATASEVSVTYHAYPDRARPEVQMSPKIAPTGTISDAVSYRRDFPDGRIGSDPTQSNADDGARIVAVAAEAVLEEVRRFAA